ncbi:pilus (MSHA type) biogenesis protein MshL [Vibrio brasiliensis]|uniref:MSHA biogenesis protein MshL n=1 Tax=Vibrio brasiliensis LMG 20546 TaxID=945543 RepID=E8LQ55_9VIBR|nr:pilus (MSHA type) biogenesis protein MshL [Vibrio brasiliensis]EGA67117.1 MSHA biogenesis protein MshL [Vibrio brasiliensis LMG 20546]MCG9727812.1 pilus (MSHA type) biogenesis protein MshL [Vibrio brasiliensis]
MRKLAIAITITSLLAGCSMGHRDPIEAKSALNQVINEQNSRSLETLPPSVEADLMPELVSDDMSANQTIKRFRIKANGVEAKAFFTSLVKGTEFSAAIHPDVTGEITVNLSDVSLDEVLSVVQDMYGYDVVKTGNVIQIYPAGLRTVTLPVDYLQFKRSGRSLTSISTGTITNTDGSSSSSSSDSNSSSSSNSSSTNSTRGGTEIETINESDFWPQLESAVSQLIGSGSGQSVVVSPQASVITVRAFPDEIREIRNFLMVSQQRMHRQVILEAKILEVTLSDGYQQGINWSKAFTSNGTNYTLGQGSTIKDSTTGLPVTLPGLDAIGTLLGGQSNLVISSGSFEAVLSFMATQGDLNVLSSPRVTASNNQKAVIKVGTDSYFVTDFSANTDSSSSTTNTTTDIELTPFFSGISLDVTPQIDDQGNVLLHVHPAVIDVTQEQKEINYGSNSLTLPLATSSIRESDSVIRAQDGDVVVIGGLMKSNTVEQVSKVPFLGDVPALGHLFRNTSQLTQKTELVILLKPSVVGINTWQKELERSRDLLQEWFPDEQQ